jgi:hypothetical protein
LTGFLKRNFRKKKGHQLLNFGEIGVDGLEKTANKSQVFCLQALILPDMTRNTETAMRWSIRYSLENR